jgi:hypothetical protein
MVRKFVTKVSVNFKIRQGTRLSGYAKWVPFLFSYRQITP